MSLPMPAKMRIKRELALLSKDPPPGIALAISTNDNDNDHNDGGGGSINNLTQFHATIRGPESTPFSAGIFLLSITVPTRYPFEPPKLRFLTPIYHPNIDTAGRICLDTLKSQPTGSWSPAVSLPSLLLSIRALMGEPNGEDGLQLDVTKQFKEDYGRWCLVAEEWTKREATDEKLEIMEQRLFCKDNDDSNDKNDKNEKSSGQDDNGNDEETKQKVNDNEDTTTSSTTTSITSNKESPTSNNGKRSNTKDSSLTNGKDKVRKLS